MKIEIYLDHRYLNETLPLMNTTAENMVVWIYEKMAEALTKASDNIRELESNLFAYMKHRQAMQKQDGSGWKLSKIPVMEIFGPTIQGEGMVIGQKTMFVRTAGCDYSCAWCDSCFYMGWSGKDQIKQMTAEEIWT